MTQKEFYDFNKIHKPISIGDISDFGMVIIFDNYETVRVSCIYEEISYIHQSEEIKTDPKQILKDINELQPKFIDEMLIKYRPK